MTTFRILLLAAAMLAVPLFARAPLAFCATCVGGTPCRACTNCSSCRLCNQRGGSCGACRRGALPWGRSLEEQRGITWGVTQPYYQPFYRPFPAGGGFGSHSIRTGSGRSIRR